MNIGIFGTGVVAQALAPGIGRLGHSVMIGTRNPAELMERRTPAQGTKATFAEWSRSNPEIRVGAFADTARFGELLINATSGGVSVQVLEQAGEENLGGKVLIDAANPLDFSRGFPPTLLVKDTDSLGEQIQRAFPKLRVVKSLNTVSAAVMTAPRSVGNGDHSIFVCGNDAPAKKEVSDLLRSLGWSDVIDLGDITASRGTEMYLPLWLRLWGALGTPMLNVKIVRG
jgi:8-hydroxy-5-deazaflavin:NADPH oxidoreductase